MKLFFYDLETTGLGFDQGIVQVAWATVDMAAEGLPEIHSTLVNPEMPIQPGAMAVHGITEVDVAFAPTLPEVWEKIKQEAMEADFVVGYNSIAFDTPLLNSNLTRYKLDSLSKKELDVMRIAMRLRNEGRRKLTYLDELYSLRGFAGFPPHDARGDVNATIKLFKHFVATFGMDAVLDMPAPLPDGLIELTKLFSDIKREEEAIKKRLDDVRLAILEQVEGDENDVETPFVKISARAGRKTVDWKGLASEFNPDKGLIAKFTSTGKPFKTITLI